MMRTGLSHSGEFGTPDIVTLARRVFGNEDVAREWMRTPNSALGQTVPQDMAKTEEGARSVKAVLLRIEHGIYE